MANRCAGPLTWVKPLAGSAASVLVALVYYVIYRWPVRTTSTLEPSRRASEG